MKVKFVNPHNKKFGTTEHIENTTGRTLIALGECEEVAAPARGTAQWLAWRQEQSALATAPSAYDTPASTHGAIEWGVQTQKSGQVVVITRFRGEVSFLDGCPPNAPAGIRQQFLDACAVNPEANAIAIEIAKRAQEEQARKDKWAGQSVVRTAIFGSKPL